MAPWLELVDSVDVIGIDRQSGCVRMAIVDGVDWSDVTRHLHLVQEKLNAYIRFIESGQLLSAYPDARGRPISIEWRHRYPLPQDARDFLARAEPALIALGVEITTTQVTRESRSGSDSRNAEKDPGRE
jgi:hypothetical protein